MRQVKAKILTLAAALLVAGAPAVFAQSAASPAARGESPWSAAGAAGRIGFGPYSTAGFGNGGLTAVPGLGILFAPVVVNVHLGSTLYAVEVAASVEWEALDVRLGTSPVSLFLGPGAYAAYGTGLRGFSFTAFGTGLMGTVGVHTTLFDTFEGFASLVPSAGVEYLDGAPSFVWNIGLELGARFLLPRPRAPRSLDAPVPLASPVASAPAANEAPAAVTAAAPTPADAAAESATDGSATARADDTAAVAVEVASAPAAEAVPTAPADPAQASAADAASADAVSAATEDAPAEPVPPAVPVVVSTPRPMTLSAPAFFDPLGAARTLVVRLRDGSADAASWRMTVTDAAGRVVSTRSGSGPAPLEIAWDGKLDSGRVIDGTYAVQVTEAAADGSTVSAEPAVVTIASTPPRVDRAPAAAAVFAPDPDATSPALSLPLSIVSTTPVAKWSLDITEPSGGLFRRIEGTGEVPSAIPWDGTGTSGERVQSEETYGYAFHLTDVLDRSATARGTFRTGLIINRDGDTLKLAVPSLVFVPNKASLVSDASEAGSANLRTLADLAAALQSFARYRVTVIGHAVNVSGTPAEEKEVLALSVARATFVRDELVRRGVNAARITTEGRGSAEPVVPASDKQNAWKNRRVEFVLALQEESK